MTKRQAGLSALDILIAVLVLSALLFVAAHQFGAYDNLSGPVDNSSAADPAAEATP